MQNYHSILWSLLIGLFFHFNIQAQSTNTANDVVPEVNDFFRYGINPDFYPNWGTQDTTLANISAGNPNVGVAGAGVKAWRATLPEWFINQFGIKVRTFAFEHYEDIGMDNHTVFLEGPQADHIDQTQYCAGTPSTIFSNLYLDIWDNGENGTPVNDNNHYALYCYKVATEYSPYVKFWEIWNEPDFSSSAAAFNPPGTPGSWWDNDPDPCDMKIKAPIYNYIRMLRISYEVIKSIDPDAFITTGGIGFPSFLDAIMRNTDNPNDGVQSADYPHQGGAYFDAVSFHQYPHIDGCFRIGWNNETQSFDYKRHSDGAADCLVERKDDYQAVLSTYGYDGSTFPQKEYIITESNIPRKGISNGDDNFGNDEIQRNWIIKACVRAQQNDISQFHVYRIGEGQDIETASFEFQVMGLYKNLNASTPYNQEYTDEGVAYRTMSEELFGYTYDAQRTAGMSLPDNVEGGAFRNENNLYRYVLWARTDTDTSEDAIAEYQFPQNWNINMMTQKSWSSAITGAVDMVQSTDINLTGAPSFIEPISFFGTNNLEVTLLVNDASCEGANDGRIVALPSGGTPPYSFAWSTDPGSFSASNSLDLLSPGFYEVTVQDANLSTVTVSTIVTAPASLVIEIDAPNLTCVSPVVSVLYEQDDEVIFEAEHDIPGTYTQVLEVPGGCDITLQYTVEEDMTLPIADAGVPTTGTVVACEDSQVSGFLDGSGSSTGSDFIYLWATTDGLILSGETSLSCEYGANGTYTLTVTNTSNGCTTTASTEVNIDVTLSDLQFVSADIQNSIENQATGSISPTISGGQMPYAYTWSNGATSSTLMDIAAGAYGLTLTDAEDCVLEEVFTVEEESTTSASSVQETAYLNVFPNPTDGLLQIESSHVVDDLKLLDITGQQIWNYNGSKEKQIKLDFNFLPPGIYMLKYEMNNSYEIKRIIIF